MYAYQTNYQILSQGSKFVAFRALPIHQGQFKIELTQPI